MSRAAPLTASEPVHVLLAVTDPAVDEETLQGVTAALHLHLAELAQRRVQYALVTDGAASGR